MSTRKFLKKSILLHGQSDGKSFDRTFHIVRKIKEGASVVCYEAYHENSARGVLKEFYPAKALWLERDKDGHLRHDETVGVARERFEAELARYLRPYDQLLQARQEAESRDWNFIPHYEIYRGSSDGPNAAATAYIWTTEPESVTFESICAEIRKQPDKRPEYQLVKILSAMVSLTECIRVLHNAGFVHRDIKPGNFGFASRDSEALTQSVSLFDLDSVCPMYPLPRDRVISDGFTEPEALDFDNSRYSAGCQTDIYSIGATLFSAVILTPETEADGGHYRPEYEPRLRELIAQSKLITASPHNAHPKLRSNLYRVLQRCLSPRASRYTNCDDLLDDLSHVLRYALPPEVARRHIPGERWVLTDAEKSLDRDEEKNAALALHYHLYEKPLYARCDPQKPAMNVLVVGFGNYGQKFLDLSLQVGQMRGRDLTVTIVSDDPEDKQQYLSDRPELGDYFAVDSPVEPKKHYGRILFEPVVSLERENRKQNFDIMQDLMIRHCDEERPLHYVFIALGDDELNRSAAEAVYEAAQLLEMSCDVHFVWEGDDLPGDLPEGLSAVPVHRDVRRSAFHSEMERMAYHTHKVWEKDWNIPHSAMRAKFRKPYNHDASISNVLSLKYKLYSIGIDLDRVDFDTAAEQFSTGKKTWKNELIWMEHRRWVVEKLCDGWRQLKNLEECPSGTTKDDRRKRHICIVRSDPNQNLASGYRANNYEKWDTATDAELNKLDDLDRLSVLMHRMYVRKAEEMRRQNLFHESGLTAIRNLVEGNTAAAAAFSEWYTCIKEIWNRDYRKVYLYESRKNALVQAAEQMPKQTRDVLENHIRAFESVFYPIRASVAHRDFKQDDVAMVDSIPWILTSREDLYMAVPYSMGSNSAMFANLAAAAAADPARVLYLCHLDSRYAARELLASLPYIARFLEKMNIRAALEFVIAYNDQAALELPKLGLEQMKAVLGSRLRQVKAIHAQDPVKLAQLLGEYLAKRGASKSRFVLEKNQTTLSYLLQGAGVYGGFSSYRFDPVAMKFYDLERCDFLRHIRSKTGITVADMLSLRRSSGGSDHPEFFGEYQNLWERYRKNSRDWKAACTVLGDYAKEQDVLAVISQNTDRGNQLTAVQRRYLAPVSCINGARKLVKALVSLGVLEPQSCVNSHTTSSCEILVLDKWQNKATYDALFSNHPALMNPDALDIHQRTGRSEVEVSFDNLVVSKLRMPLDRRSEFKSQIQFFESKGFITNVRINGDLMDFTYATRQIKELMTTAGKMLEVYTYHKARETGKFDDVVSSYELSWEGTDVLSEFDCILTRGFQSLFIECKARTKIEQDYYYKLASLAQQFGINAKAVLIADTQEWSGSYFASVNDMQRQRGAMMDVITVWDANEIQNIGKTLLSILDGTYEQKF